MRWDIVVSVIVGGGVSMAILITAAGSGIASVEGVEDLVLALEPIYGSAARYGMGIGLLAAGITSAITAPLAAAYVARQCFDWEEGSRNWKFRAVWLGVLLSGVLSLLWEFKPLEVIFVAQVANAILLPLIAGLLWWMASSNKLLGSEKNGIFGQIMAMIILMLVTGLAVRSLIQIFS
jgi:Mn2+/Fe2+ NRAMP family transporter